MKKFLIIVLTFKLFFHASLLTACGGGDEDYYEYKYFFSPTLLSDTSLLRYFPSYTSCDVCGGLLKKAVLEEWNNKFNTCSIQDIETGLYGKLGKEQIESLSNSINPLPDNSFYALLLQNNLTEVIKYLGFIAEENTLMVPKSEYGYTYYWEEEDKNLNEGGRLLSLAKENFKNAEDPFIKDRYVFQILKLLHYTGNYEEAMDFFESYYPIPSSSLIYYRTLGYYAGAKRKTKAETEAKYLYAKIFDQCPPIRYQAYNDFKYIDQEESQWKTSLALAKNNSERSAMWIAKNIYEYVIDIKALKELYENDSSSARLELALIKQLNNFHYEYYVNKLKESVTLDSNKVVKRFSLNGEIIHSYEAKDNWFVSLWKAIVNFFRNLFGSSSEENPLKWDNKMPEIKYMPVVFQEEWLDEWLELINTILAEDKVQNKKLFLLAKGYLQIAKGEFDKGQTSLKGIKKGEDVNIDKIAAYLQIWSELLKAPQLEESLERKILVYLKANKNEFELEEELARRYFIERKYAQAYQSFKLAEKIAFFEDEIIIDIIKNGNSKLSPSFVSYFGKIYVSQLKDDFAQKLFFTGKFEEAAAYSNLKLAMNAPYGQTDESEVPNIAKADGYISYKTFSKLDKEGTADSYLKIANVLANSYNMPYNGYPCYNYLFTSYYKVSEYPFNIPGMAEVIENRYNYYLKWNNSTDLAENYFIKAHDLLKTDEEKAAILVSAQKLAMRDKYALRDRWNNPLNKAYFYSQLKEKYPNTDIVKELNNSCSFFRNEKIDYY